MAQQVRNPPVMHEMQETQVRLWVGKIFWRRKWQPTPVFLPEKSQEQRSLVAKSSKESDMSERLSTHIHISVSLQILN